MKVLVIRFSSLGDCVLLLPLLTHLKESGAKEVAVLTKNRYREIFACARGVDRMILLAENSSAATAYKIAASLRKKQYLVIDAHNTLRSRLITALMREGGPRLKKHYLARLGVIVFKKNADLPSMIERYFDLAEELFPRQARSPVPGGDMILPESAVISAEQRLDKAGKHIIAVSPGARWPAKRWEVGKYARLVRIIIEKFDYSVILLGDYRDAAAAGVICSQSRERIFDFTGRTGIIETAALLKSCKALICNDSGLLHLAEAVGTPVLSIFGPTTEHFGYYPAHAKSKVCERRLPCRPCSRNGSRPCFMGTHSCLAEIRTDSVVEVFKDMMDGAGIGRYTLP